ncbi:MAG: NigD-like C-terminal domain-containing protein [Alistipes sp.]
MKKFGLLLLAATAALVFSSCNEEKGDYPAYANFVTVKSLDKDFFLQLDNNKTVYPSDKTRLGVYDAKEGQRAIVYFNLLPQKVEGYDYNAALYLIQNIYTGTSRIIDQQAELDKASDDKIDLISRPQLNENYLMLAVGYPVHDNTKHSFELIQNKVTEPGTKFEGYLNVELRHNAGGETQGSEGQYWTSYNLDALKEAMKGMTGLTVRVNTQRNNVQYYKIDLPKK